MILFKQSLRYSSYTRDIPGLIPVDYKIVTVFGLRGPEILQTHETHLPIEFLCRSGSPELSSKSCGNFLQDHRLFEEPLLENKKMDINKNKVKYKNYNCKFRIMPRPLNDLV